MNKSEMADSLCDRSRVNKAAAKGTVYGGFAMISEALIDGDEVRRAELGTFAVGARLIEVSVIQGRACTQTGFVKLTGFTPKSR